jgi:iron complex transport system substrate-binding protein
MAAVAGIRLVSADAGVTATLFALGLGDEVVAVDVTSTLPAEKAGTVRIGYHRNLSAEGLLSLAPTHLVGSDHMGPDSTLAVLRRAEVDVVQLPVPYSVATLRDNVARLGEALGETARVAGLVSEIDSLQAQVESRSLAGSRVAFLLNTEGDLRLAGSDTAGAAFIDLLGGNNVADYRNYRSVSTESLLAYAPEIIIVAGDQADGAEALLRAQPLLAQTPAGKTGQVVSLDGSTLVGGLSLGALREALNILKSLTLQAAQ